MTTIWIFREIIVRSSLELLCETKLSIRRVVEIAICGEGEGGGGVSLQGCSPFLPDIIVVCVEQGNPPQLRKYYALTFRVELKNF